MSNVLDLTQKTRVVPKRTTLDLRFGECKGRKLGDFGVSCHRGSWILAWRLEMCTNRGQDKLMIPSTIHNETFADMSVSLPSLTLLGLNTGCYVLYSLQPLWSSVNAYLVSNCAANKYEVSDTEASVKTNDEKPS